VRKVFGHLQLIKDAFYDLECSFLDDYEERTFSVPQIKKLCLVFPLPRFNYLSRMVALLSIQSSSFVGCSWGMTKAAYFFVDQN
jgi:hypothetical protein